MRVLTIFSLLMLVPLAGCLSGDDAETQSVPEEILEQEVANVLEMTSCTEFGAVVPVPAMEFGGLPEGFSPIYMDPLGLTVAVIASGQVCDDVFAADLNVTDLAAVTFILPVEPAEEYIQQGVDAYAFMLAYMPNSDDVVNMLVDWDLGEEAFLYADVLIDQLADTASAQAAQVRLDTEWGSFDMDTAATGEQVTFAAGVARGFVMDAEGQIDGAVDYAWTEYQGLESGAAQTLFDAIRLGPLSLGSNPLNTYGALAFQGADFEIRMSLVGDDGLLAESSDDDAEASERTLLWPGFHMPA